MQKWETEDGIIFLKKIGLKKGDKVLDFGARVGHYTIPASYLVGRKGQIVAVDKDTEGLGELEQKLREKHLSHIQIIKISGEIDLDFEKGSFDAILLYDVLHYLSSKQRSELYENAWILLKPGGLLSVYPKHLQGDSPSQYFAELKWDDVQYEIEECGFVYTRKECDLLSHDDELIPGCVFNFKKPDQI